ncbi:MAG TPA: aminotransferase class IV [Bacteroidales bacterium]
MAANDTFIIVDGNIYRSDEQLFNHNNRSFCFGDGLFESMHAYGTDVQLFNLHFERLTNGIKALKMQPDKSFTPAAISKQITHLLNKNKLFTGARVKVILFRKDGGRFLPETNDFSYIIETKQLEQPYYLLNKKGCSIEIFKDITKTASSISSFKTTSSAIYVMASIFAHENGYDDCLILNQKQELIESCNSNLFVVKNNVLLTPAADSGCVSGVMRRYLMTIAKEAGINVIDNIPITESMLLEADEIFLTNAISGIRWVQAFRNRRYYNAMSQNLIKLLNKSVFGV